MDKIDLQKTVFNIIAYYLIVIERRPRAQESRGRP